MTTYYVKSAGSDGNTGLSDAQAWATPAYAMAQVAGSSSNHKVLFKCGDTFYSTSAISLNYSGTDKNNLSIFGSYYMSGGSEVQGVSGVRPQIYGDFEGFWQANTAVSLGKYYAPHKGGYNGCWYEVTVAGTTGSSPPSWPTTEGATVVSGTATFRAWKVSSKYLQNGKINIGDSAQYFRIENIRTGHYRGRGISVERSSNAIAAVAYHEIYNANIEETGDAAVMNGRYSHTDTEWVYDQLFVYQCGRAPWDGRGDPNRPRPGFLWTKGRISSTGVSLTREIKNSTFTKSTQEFIPSAQKQNIHGNIFHACLAGTYLHSGNSSTAYGCKYNNIYSNMYVGSTDSYYWYNNSTYCGTAIGCTEEPFYGPMPGVSDNNIYNNVISFCYNGLSFNTMTLNGVTYSGFNNSKFIFNTLVDNRVAIATSTSGHSGVTIKNNCIYNYTPGLIGYSGAAHAGVDADYNCWNSPAMAGNFAGANDVYSDPLLTKSTGWQLINDYNDITSAAAKPLDGSPLIGAGVTITGYTTDIDGNTRSSPPDIGAWDVSYTPPGGGGGGGRDTPQIQWADKKTGVQSSGASRSFTKPSNLSDGDTIVVIFTTDNCTTADATSNISNVTGFTEIDSSRDTSSASRPECVGYYKYIATAAGEPSSYSFSTTQGVLYMAVRVSATDSSGPIGVSSAANSGSSSVSSLNLTGITTTEDHSMIFAAIASQNGNSTGFAATGMTNEWEYRDGSLTFSQGGLDEEIDSAGATGDRNVSWTTAGRAAGLLFEIIGRETPASDVDPPEYTVLPYVSANDDTDVTITSTLTDDTATNIEWYGVATSTYLGNPTAAEIIAGTAAGGVAAFDDDNKTDIDSGVSDTLTLTGITEPKVKIATIAKDSEGNTQAVPLYLIQFMDPPSGTEYTEVTIDSGAVANSVLFGLTYNIGDVIVYPSVTNEDSLAISIDSEGLITITRGGNTAPQTFEAYLWSLATGATQAITYQDPFYQSNIGPFGNSTNTKLTNTTVYVVAALDTNEDGTYEIPLHRPLNILVSVSNGAAVAVDLDSDGIGVYYNQIPGKYYGEVYTLDGSYQGKLGYNQTIGITVA